jgi:hypothetical protein
MRNTDLSEAELKLREKKPPKSASQIANRFSLDVETASGMAFPGAPRSPGQSRRYYKKRLRGKRSFE